MASFKKVLAVSFISATLIVVPIRANAIIPLIAGWILVATGGSILISDLIAGQVGIITAVLWWDCNKFALNAPCTSKTPIPAAQQPKPAITINLAPDAKRENPNPAKFNDPTPGKRDVTPKPQIAAAGSGPPPAPAGPVGTGVYAQNPSDPSTGPSSDETLQYMAERSHAYGDVTVAGVITVKQAFAPDRAFPFVAKVVSCTYRTDISSQSQEVLDALADCTSRQNASNAALEAAYLTPQRYPYYVGIRNAAPGSIIAGKAVVFYDQAKDVTVNCDAGYQLSGTYVGGEAQCALVDATLVRKPTDTPCEMLFDAGTKQMVTDTANPACAGITSSSNVTVGSADGKSSINVKANAGNGFDVCINKADGGKSCLDTGVYDPGTGGYVIVHTTITPPPDPNTGLGCGGPGQGVCSMVASTNADMQDKDAASRTSIDQANTGMKGKMDGIDPNKFQWSFIPQIPTTVCVNPSVRNPVTGGPVEMDICGGFNKFTFFLNAVLAIACVYGCVRQVQSAMKA